MRSIIFLGRRGAAGFTLIETLVVVGIIGIFAIVSFPSILNIMEERNLENTARRVQTCLQQAKLRSVTTKTLHRVRFDQVGSTWGYEIEEVQADGVTWVRVPRAPRETIPNRFTIAFTIPAVGSGHAVEFSPVGNVSNFSVGLNEIVIRSPKLDRPGREDERVISIFWGGSIGYAKRTSS